MKYFILLALLSTYSLSSFAGHGKDGGWPQSIQLLKIAKENLLDLLKQSNDQEVKDAINGMKDRTESIPLESVNLVTLTRLVNLLENPDVEKIENSKYEGVRLFYYDDSNPSDLKLFATKNFYNLAKYQINTTELNAAIIKEIQTLILHEVSHFWGFGEANEKLNYSRMFAVRMINILHGSLKISFTQQEKMASLNKAFRFNTENLRNFNACKPLENEKFNCLTIDANQEVESTVVLKLDGQDYNSDGHIFQDDKNTLLRGTLDNYVVVETTSGISNSNSSNLISSYYSEKGLNRLVQKYTICHQDPEKVKNYVERLVRPYFTRSNLLTDYDKSSLVVFQSRLIQNVESLINSYKSSITIKVANQQQLIENIDYKIKVQHKDSYDRLTSIKRKYSKDKDHEDMEIINSLLNSGLSEEGSKIWAQVIRKQESLSDEIKAKSSSMENYGRAIQMNSFFEDFSQDLNDLTERFNQSILKQDREIDASCESIPSLGKHFSCIFEASKPNAQVRIKMYEKLNVDIDAVLKRYTNRANELKD